MSNDIIFGTPGLPALIYISAIDKALDGDWKYWEPEALWAEIEDDMGININAVDDTIRNKILAYRTCMNSHIPWQQWSVFLNVCEALNGYSFDPEVVRFYSAAHLIWAMEQMLDIAEDRDWMPSVVEMLAILLYNEGVYWLPNPWGAIVNKSIRRLLPEENKSIPDEIQKAYSVFNDGELGEDWISIAIGRILIIEDYIDSQHKLEGK